MLDNTNKKNPFSVPENYFQNFNSEIMNMLPEKQVDNKKKIVPLWKSVTKWGAAAAVVAGLALFGVNYMNNESKKSTDPILADDQNENAIENEYYEFLESEAIRVAYSDTFFSDEL
ncbi:MAG: hypothetical protein E6772_04070 [Dysgonomonas sp.]|nr:hypothetical protein [Dysgonomonas sp.]